MTNLNILKKLIKENPNSYSRILKAKYPEIIEWINSSTPLLSDACYNMKTRIYWVINNLKDFPLCKNCGKKLIGKNITSLNSGYFESCSVKCSSSLKERIDKIKNTCLEKYGVDNYAKTKEYENKSKKTCLEKYGVEYSFQSKNNKNKSKETCLEKYGVDNCMKNKDIRNKSIDTVIEKYGVDNVFKSKIIKKKIQRTMMKKYGVSSPMKCENIKNKSFYNSHLSLMERSWNNNILNDEYSSPNFSKNFYLENYNRDFEFEFTCKKCGNKYMSKHYDGIHKRCSICYKNTSSFGEKELVSFIKSFYNGKIIENTKDVIPPYEIDIYIPEKNIAIEFDGLYWHSTQIMNLKNNSKTYHLVKTKMCDNKCIQLIHIFEDEWNNKKEIVKSRLMNLLGINNKTVYARDCDIVYLSSSESFEFLETNHIQGGVKSPINLGLKYNNEIIAIMTFGKNRISLGLKSKPGEYELIRFCSKLGWRVIGGAGKLLKHFERVYNPLKLISYADYRWSVGKMYDSLGFKLSHVSRPNYWYLDKSCLKRYHRFAFRKSLLKDKLEIFDENLSEKENMTINGYKTIYDCGNLVFVKEY